MTSKDWFIGIMWMLTLGTCGYAGTHSHPPEPVLTEEVVKLCSTSCGPAGVAAVRPDDCDCNMPLPKCTP